MVSPLVFFHPHSPAAQRSGTILPSLLKNPVFQAANMPPCRTFCRGTETGLKTQLMGRGSREPLPIRWLTEKSQPTII
jgi:hypothetical protein